MRKTICLIFFFSLLFLTLLPANAAAADNFIRDYIEASRASQDEVSRGTVDDGTVKWMEVLPDSIPAFDALNNDGKKIAFLTFDDGPSKNVTPAILDILKKYNIKATFFMVGGMAINNGDMVKRIYSEGHSIGNHSYYHRYSYNGVADFMGEVELCESVLKGILGKDFPVKLFRFPGGSFGSKDSSLKTALVEHGYSYINWNVSTGDASGNNVPANLLISNVKAQSRGNDHIVVLMHDLGSKHTTVEALPSIIEYLISQGYEFKKLM